MKYLSRPTARHMAMLALALGLGAGAISSADQGELQRADPAEVQIGPVPRGAQGPANPTPPNELLSNASVEFDVDADSMLDRAADYFSQAQYREALLLYQHVLDKYPHAMAIDAHGVYVPSSQLVWDILAKAPPEALSLYRLTADAEARALLGPDPAACQNLDALAQVARQYFLSSLGDESLFTLACLQMDRGQYAQAASALLRLIESFPDPSINQRQLLERLVIASAKAGDAIGAAQAIEQYRKLEKPDDRAQRIIAVAQRELEADGPVAAVDGWLRVGGSMRGELAMPAMRSPVEHRADGLWALMWQHSFNLRSPYGRWGGNYFQLNANAAQSRGDLVRRWREKNWTPTGQILFKQDRVFYKSHEQLICRDRATGEEIWNLPTVDPALAKESSGQHRSYYGYYHQDQSPWPTTAEEVLFFGDSVSKEICLIDGAIYHIESNDIGTWLAEHELQARQQPNNGGRFVGGNALVAVDAASGKVLWRIGRSADLKAELGMVRFRSLPMLVNGKLILPVEENGELFIVGLSPQSGKMLFKQFACAFPTSYAPPWSTGAMVVVDDELYLLPGEGIIVCASALDGKVRWARPYKPTHPDRQYQEFSPNQSIGRWSGVMGWQTNRLLVVGDTLVAAPWDAQQLLLIDRRTGRLRTTGPGGQPQPISTPEARDLVGAYTDHVVVAQASDLVAYSLAEGKVAWRASVPGLSGQPALTPDAIYVPCGEMLVCLDPKREGKRVAQLRVLTPRGDPLGNLYSDGQRLLATGMNYIYALADAKVMLAQLGSDLGQSPTAAAHLQRARLHDQLGQSQQAIEDFRAALALAQRPYEKDQAREELVGRLLKLLKANLTAPEAPALLAELEQLAGQDGRWNTEVALLRGDYLAASGQIAGAMDQFRSLMAGETQAESTRAMVSADDAAGSVELLVATAAGQRLAVLARSLPEVQPIFEQASQAQWAAYEQAVAAASLRSEKASAQRMLYELARTYPGSTTAMLAIQKLGQLDPDLGTSESAAYLDRLIAASDPPAAALASAVLAQLHQQAGQTVAALDACSTLARFDTQSISWNGQPISAALLAQQLGAAIGPMPQAITHAMPTPPLKRVWEMRGYGNYLLEDTQDSRSPFLDEHFVLLSRSRRSISAHKIDSVNFDQPLWNIPLSEEVVNRIYVSNNEVVFSGDIRGDLLVVRGAKQLAGYSLITGKCLWTRDEPDNEQERYEWLRNQRRNTGLSPFCVGEKVIVRNSIDEQMNDQVEVIDATALMGGTTLWRRSFTDSSVTAVWASGDAVIVLLDGGKRMVLCDAASGLVRHSVELAGPIHRAMGSDQRLLLQDSQSTVACYDLSNLQVVWREKQGVGQFGLLNDQSAFLYRHDGTIILRDLASDRVIKRLERKSEEGHMGGSGDVAVSADGSRLYALGWDNQGRQIINIISLSDEGQRLQVEVGQQYYQPPSMRQIARSTGPILWVTRQQNERGEWKREGEIVFFDRDTGKRIDGASMPLIDPANPKRQLYPSRAPYVVGNTMILTTNDGVIGFCADPDAKLPAQQPPAVKPEGNAAASPPRDTVAEEE